MKAGWICWSRGLHLSLSEPQVFPAETPADARALWRAKKGEEPVPVPRSLQGEQTGQAPGERRARYCLGDNAGAEARV